MKRIIAIALAMAGLVLGLAACRNDIVLAGTGVSSSRSFGGLPPQRVNQGDGYVPTNDPTGGIEPVPH
jgi:hypothetical protein